MNDPLFFTLLFILGMITWTFTEYALHRGLGHKRKRKNPFTVEHLLHHKKVNYFAKPIKKVISACLVFSLMMLLLSLIGNLSIALSFSSGFIWMYLIYEMVHRRIHTHAPHNQYGRWMRKHHLHHHFKNPRVNHGVTTPFWDWVFGTLEIPNTVRVPQNLILKWMLDLETGRPIENLQIDYDFN